MKKTDWLAGMISLIAAMFTLMACGGKEKQQKAVVHESEDTTVGICPCCEAELAEMGDTIIVDSPIAY